MLGWACIRAIWAEALLWTGGLARGCPQRRQAYSYSDRVTSVLSVSLLPQSYTHHQPVVLPRSEGLGGPPQEHWRRQLLGSKPPTEAPGTVDCDDHWSPGRWEAPSCDGPPSLLGQDPSSCKAISEFIYVYLIMSSPSPTSFKYHLDLQDRPVGKEMWPQDQLPWGRELGGRRSSSHPLPW